MTRAPDTRIRNVNIPGTNVVVPRLIFGTASLFNAGPRKKRLALLSAAVEAGLSHFDTAPYYGFGWAERDLGALRAAGTKFTVTTKVGIYSPGGEDSWQSTVFLRKAAGRAFPSISRPTVDFQLKRAMVALEASLSRLRTDHIEIYLLHEPDVACVRSEEWQRWLECEVSRGRIGSFGLASTASKLVPFLDSADRLSHLVQVLDSLDGEEADVLLKYERPLQITYGYVSSALSINPARSVDEILRGALRRNTTGAIIVSTKKKERIRQYAEILEKVI
ncbi:aldo/keto reductase [Mesorhizobium sp. M1169]|uniref:aldo/keto reductase n=1 Tax=Mesorhizobium sp. M1169 TaxID=2957066 RepID=UPI00333B91FD